MSVRDADNMEFAKVKIQDLKTFIKAIEDGFQKQEQSSTQIKSTKVLYYERQDCSDQVK